VSRERALPFPLVLADIMSLNLDTRTYRKDLKFKPGHGYGRRVGNLWLGTRPAPPRSILYHTTNNPRGNTSYPSEARFLRDSADVSIQYVVSSDDDTVVQVLPDDMVAWHSGSCYDAAYENNASIGIEIAWTINKGPLPQIAIENLTELTRHLLTLHPQIGNRLDLHRRQAQPKGRKTDPAGWTDAAFDAWRDMVLQPVPFVHHAEDSLPAPINDLNRMNPTSQSPILGPASATAAQCIAYIKSRPHGTYTVDDVATIVRVYFGQAELVGVDPVVAIAQMIHETGNLTSALSQRADKYKRPLRNPAGIGVNGDQSSIPLGGYVWDSDRGMYRRCVGFRSWADESIPAHLGRLLAYALPVDAASPIQQEYIDQALRFRGLPAAMRGSSPRLEQLGASRNPTRNGWASPGDRYGAAIAEVMTAIQQVRV